jgi:PAS domain S-box-containing protein
MVDKDQSHRSAAPRKAQRTPAGREALERALARANEALERKTRELAHSAALMQATMDATTNGILVMDEHRKVAGFNAKFGEMWKIPREILAAQDYRAVLAHASRRFDDPRAFLDGVEAIYATCPAETFDLLRLRDGRVIERHSKIQTVDGRYAGRVFSFHDITERVRAKERWTQSEAALRESEGFNRTIVESSNDCIKTLSLEGTLLWINDNGAAQLRIPDTAAVLGKSWFDTWHGEDRVAAEQGVAAAAAGGTGRFVGYYPINGEPHWFDVVITPIVDAAGKPARLLAVSRDVTDRRRSESALR